VTSDPTKAAPRATTFRFGEFVLDAAARELKSGPRPVPLPPKAFDCIVYLIAHRERAVGRDELISAVWGRIDVSDDVLAQTLLRARRAVDDTGNEQRAIRTVPRFGYRWVLSVEEWAAPALVTPDLPVADTTASDTTASDATASTTPASRSRVRVVFVSVAILAVLALIAAIVWSRADRRGITGPSATHALLVLPVDVRGGDSESTWIRLGAMEYLASRLRERTSLQVLPSEQTLLLVGQDTDPSDAGTLNRLASATSARYVLAPHATFGGGQWAFVLDAYHDGGVISYEARGANPLDTAGIALARFTASLGVSAASTTGTTAATEFVQRMDAAMLAGDLVQAHRLVDTTPENLRNDPSWRVRAGQIAFRAGQLDAASALFAPLASDASGKSDVRAQAQMGLGAVAVRQGDFDAADRQYSAAIATLHDPHDDPDLIGSAYSGRGVANGARDRVDPALADFGRARVEFERAGDRTGAATIDVNLALIEGGRGRYAEAVAAFDRAIATFNRFDVRDNLAAALIGKTNAQLALLDSAGALASSERAATLARQLENPLLKRRIGDARVRALLAAGALGEAGNALDAFDTGDRGKPEMDALRAWLAIEHGDANDAGTRLGTLLEWIGDDNSPPSPSELTLIAIGATRLGAPADRLERALDRLRAAKDPSSDRDHDLALELGVAELDASRGQPSAAGHFAAALALADRRGAPDAIVRVATANIAWLLSRGDVDVAAPLVGRLSGFADDDYRAARATAAYYRATGAADQVRSADAVVRKLAGERDPSLPF
jgi:DNA-binding winged helix-turn-helix (wHTH) protein/tetratricopeptide (TPR) repeat protein